jgi:copper oxidase (laccase) domain-containing protein
MKGTTQGILTNVLKQLATRQVWVGIGPAVGRECYDDIDLQTENILQAKAAGVPLNHIEVMRWCTRCHHDTFFSYRAGDKQNFGTYFNLNP